MKMGFMKNDRGAYLTVQVFRNSWKSLILLVLMLTCLVACESSIYNPVVPDQRTTAHIVTGASGGAVIGATTAVTNPSGWFIGGLMGGYSNSKGYLIEKIQSYGGQVLELGDTTTILLPIDNFFAAKDDQLIHRHDPILNIVARLLNKYGNSAIKVAVATDNVDTTRRNYLLAKRQAERVASYLWQRGIDAWRFYPVAYGPNMKVATNRTVRGSAANRLLEITVDPYVTPDNCRRVRHSVSKQQYWQYWGTPY